MASQSALRWSRAHLCQSLELVLFAAFVVSFYLDGHFLLLVVRALSQIQLGSGNVLHPNRSLRFFGIACATFNLLVILQHLLFGAKPRRISLLVDFIGQEVPASRLRMLIFDLVFGSIQLAYVAIAYDQWHSNEEVTGNTAEDSDTNSFEGEEEDDGLLSTEPPRLRSADHYDSPIVRLPLRPTLRRLFFDMKTSEDSAERERLTAHGARKRARRRRRELLQTGTSSSQIDERLADASDEEREIGRQRV